MSNEIVCVKDIEKYAYKVLPRNALDYYRSGAGSEESLANNKNAFSKLVFLILIFRVLFFINLVFRLRIRPKFLKNVSRRTMSTVILGSKISMPVGIAPTAMQRMAHPDGECANAKGLRFHKSVTAFHTLKKLQLLNQWELYLH